ncbi:MAG TPA: helix-turn-helix domain-containing protein [Rhabdaerophilum sp.]|nr:helix-turn-helix domain-containing protein [Rhabdaerophilum sp.]
MALKVRKNRSPEPPPKCVVAECMDLIGGAWTPNIIWYLHGGPRRFGELKIDIPAISAKMLSARLKEMEAKGVILRRVMPTSPPSTEYELTDLGQELLPAIVAIAEVGFKLANGGKPVDEPPPACFGMASADRVEV